MVIGMAEMRLRMGWRRRPRKSACILDKKMNAFARQAFFAVIWIVSRDRFYRHAVGICSDRMT